MAKSKVDADRTLLLGLLALQMDLIDRDALIEALKAWVADRSRPIDQILRKHRAIDAEAQEILNKLARKRLDEREAESGRGAFASSLVELVRGDIARLGDPELSASVGRLGEPAPTEADPYATRLQDPGAETLHADSLSPGPAGFQLIRLHARGGLGEVYLARDEQLHREVALKQLRERHADRIESRSRFLREAEFTGSLEHPGIIPIYGMGNYSDGRPYYSMRFVDGSTLKEAISAYHRADGPDGAEPEVRSIAFRKLLRHFLGACDAIAFAHSRGVIHRDIKPDNIMIGRFGETLVVDWGLAKNFDPDEGRGPAPSREALVETMVGAPLGTPAYMSPEQAAGQIDRLGPASDVYCLGTTFYHLLTGRMPFEGGDVSQVLSRVARGQFTAPHRASRGVPAPLSMICLKAMALDPEDRYPTPQALALDIEHWLAGESVSVYRDWFPRRAWRWGRVHPWVVASVGAISFCVILVFLASALVLSIPGLILAAIGGLVGLLAGAVRGQASRGAREGSAVAFRIGTVAAAVLFLAGVGYEAVVLVSRGGPIWGVSRPGLDQLDGYRLAASRARAGDLGGAKAWYDWAEWWARRARSEPALRAEVERAKAEAAAAIGP
ncbi:serine/threonine-protein kinase [Tundrisphaera lichenicola]|uniref:serine/threonine-protein kinase n=1 Tax=Tundrisphaera lichenicola TaxID=2029860 RepID=UPI003EBD3EC5